jgi:hypothetical protein
MTVTDIAGTPGNAPGAWDFGVNEKFPLALKLYDK